MGKNMEEENFFTLINSNMLENIKTVINQGREHCLIQMGKQDMMESGKTISPTGKESFAKQMETTKKDSLFKELTQII